MTTTACTFAALLAFEAATAPATKGECELTDDRCKAALYERRSATATADHRARYLFNAHNLYVRLFEKTGDAQDLCAARRAIEASLAVDDQPESLRSESEALRTRLLARAKQQGARCRSTTKRRVAPADAPLVAHAVPAESLLVARAPEEGPRSATSDQGAPSPVSRANAPVTPTSAITDQGAPSPAVRFASDALADNPVTPAAATSGLRLLTDADPAIHRVDGLMPVATHRAPAARRSSFPRPGRGLVIASGVTLGVGVALGVSAGIIDGRMTDTRRALYSLHASVGDGFGTDAQNATDDSLRADYKTLTHRRGALAVGAGATLVVAIVLAAVGGRKMARVASRAALLPAPGGLAFRARF